jgi:Mg-chelatase subunit ChlD
VAFRDIGDAKPFETLDFTDDDGIVIKFLDQLVAYGGNDLPEDVLGALDQCLNLKNWSKSNARFIILITDAPGHGQELNNDPSDRYPKGTTHTVTSICDRLLKKDSEIELMFCCINPTATLRMQQAFEKQYDSRKAQTGKEFKTIKLFGDQPIDSRSFHFVFVLDESGSMGGDQRWSSLVKAFQSFLDRRQNDQGGDDAFSIIQFDSTARNICQQQRLASIPRNLTMQGGGTNYLAGLEYADLSIGKDTSKSSVIMIFMSDGEDGGSDPLPKMRSLRQKYSSNHAFVCHTIGFGSDIASGSTATKLLSAMAREGGGSMHSAVTNVELLNVFNKLAADCTVTGTLVAQFAEIISKEVSWKIMLDYL